MTPSDHIEEFAKKLSASNAPLTRIEAANALGKTRDPQAVPPLIEVLNSVTDWEVRTAAYLALTNIPDEVALTALIRFYADLASTEYTDEIDYEVFGDALPGSVESVGESAFPILHTLLTDANPHVRETAVWLLAEMGQIDLEQMIAGLAQALRNEDSNVRNFAMFFLQDMNHPAAKTAINDYYREVGMDDFIDEG